MTFSDYFEIPVYQNVSCKTVRVVVTVLAYPKLTLMLNYLRALGLGLSVCKVKVRFRFKFRQQAS